jgi:diphthamide biosynthesis protein 2
LKGRSDSILAPNPSPSSSLLRVALQFPPNLLPDCRQVCWALEDSLTLILNDQSSSSSETQVLVFILGDTAYGSCCVDEVAAEHLSAHVVVHYGRSCLSLTNRVPALYVFGRLQFDVQQAVTVISEASSTEKKKLLILYDVLYHYKIAEFETSLKAELGGENVVVGRLEALNELILGGSEYKSSTAGCCGDEENEEEGEGGECCGNGGADKKEGEGECCGGSSTSDILPPLPPPLPSADDQALTIGGLQIHLPEGSSLSDYTMIYVGGNSRQLVNVMMRCSGNDGTAEQWAYDPSSSTAETALTFEAATICDRELRRRYFLTQKSKSASVIGIVVGTLGVQRFKDVLTKLRYQISESGRTSYLFVVGKVNVSKLANFAEIEAFVLVACSENSLLDSREFHVPVITPFELEVALDIEQWGCYSVEFSDYLRAKQDDDIQDDDFEEEEKGEDDDDQEAPFFSLVTGTYVPQKKKVDSLATLNLANLPGQGQLTEYKSVAGDFLAKREYSGLVVNEGLHEAKKAIKGQSGIASSYEGK